MEDAASSLYEDCGDGGVYCTVTVGAGAGWEGSHQRRHSQQCNAGIRIWSSLITVMVLAKSPRPGRYGGRN